MNAHSLPGLGTLSTLPPEIRQQIYPHVFAETYYYKPNSKPIGILGVSKGLRQEAADTLYRNSTFHFEIKDYSVYSDPVIHRINGIPVWPGLVCGPCPETIDHLNHVAISFPSSSDHCGRFFGQMGRVDRFYHDLFRKLARTNRVRKSCHIIFPGSACASEWVGLEFKRDLRELPAFRKVILEMDCPAPDLEDVSFNVRYFVGLFYDIGTDGFDYVATWEKEKEKLRTFLEATLGEGFSYDWNNFRYLEFHP